ncbi:MAG: tetratricopeptide repeat protein [Planctomycetota bacterium]
MSAPRYAPAAAFAAPVLSIGLSHAHSSGFVHRDIKPDNVLFRPDGQAALADFGIVGMLGGSETAQLTQTGSILGTPAYMSPEACGGKTVDQRSDLYSLGCVMYQTLAGRIPFPADSISAALVAHVSQAPEPVSKLVECSGDIDAIILRLLEKKPKDRFPTADEVLRVLTRGYLSDSIHGTRNVKSYEAALTSAGVPLTPLTQVRTSAGRDAAAPPTLMPPPRATRSRRPPPGAAPVIAPTRAGNPAGRVAVLLLLILTAGVAGVMWQLAAQSADQLRDALDREMASHDETRALVNVAAQQAAQRANDLAAANAELDALRPLRDQVNGLRADGAARPVLDTWLRCWRVSQLQSRLPAGYKLDTLLATLDEPGLQTAVSENADRLFARAVLRAARRTDDALDDVNRVLALNPRDRMARLLRAEILTSRREFPEALREIESLLRDQPDDPFVLTRRAEVYRSNNEPDRAIEEFTRVAELLPHEADPLTSRARVRVDRYHARMERGTIDASELKTAEADLRAALERESGDLEALELLGITLQLGRDFDGALRCYDEVLKLNPLRDSTWYHRGMTLNYAGRVKEAIASMSESVRINPQSFGAWNACAMFRYQSGDVEGAVADWRHAIEGSPTHPDAWSAWTNMGAALARMGKRAEALAALDKALDVCPAEQRAMIEDTRRQVANGR